MRSVMAIYHFSAKVGSRANGSSAVASAAYRSASELHDDRLNRDHDFSNKAGVIHSEVMLPEGAPERLTDRLTLWRSEEHTSELQSLMRISYAVFCLKKKTKLTKKKITSAVISNTKFDTRQNIKILIDKLNNDNSMNEINIDHITPEQYELYKLLSSDT